MGRGEDRKEGTRNLRNRGRARKEGKEGRRKGKGRGRERSGEVFVTTSSLVSCATHAELFRLLTS